MAGGEEALAAASDLDAVVCEASLPGVETLLARFKERFPGVARTVLAPAELKGEVIARLQVLSHQVMRKPLLPALLFDLVERTVAVIQSLSSDRLRVVVGQLGDLPPLPATYAKISQMAQDPDVSMDAVAAVVERDPAITAAVLRIINSAYFGLPRRVSSVRETVRYLGIVPLKNLVLTVEVFEGLAKGKRALALQHEALLRAYAMRELLGRTALAEQAFVAGILADVGQLLLLARLPVDAMAIEKQVESGVLPWVAQAERLGCTAATIGAQLLARWNLPASLIEAVALHHQPRAAAALNVTTALSLVSAVEWSARAPEKLRLEFRKTAEELITAFPSSTVESIGRYFGGADENVA
ncbi:MAG: HDOD domain-containing protein [Archangium sp.]|nr:HDOD domain-containing protein [Archangium sp.]